MVAKTRNPWPENTDYGRLWRKGYEAGRGDALAKAIPTMVNLAERRSQAIEQTEAARIPAEPSEDEVERVIAAVMAHVSIGGRFEDGAPVIRFDVTGGKKSTRAAIAAMRQNEKCGQ